MVDYQTSPFMQLMGKIVGVKRPNGSTVKGKIKGWNTKRPKANIDFDESISFFSIEIDGKREKVIPDQTTLPQAIWDTTFHPPQESAPSSDQLGTTVPS